MEKQPMQSAGTEETWDPSKWGGMSREELKAQTEVLDRKVWQLEPEKVYGTVQHGTHILFFGSMVCPYTQAFTKEWLVTQTRIDILSLAPPSFHIAKVQCALTPVLCHHLMRSDGYPTLVLYHEGLYIKEIANRARHWDQLEAAMEMVKKGEFGAWIGVGKRVEDPTAIEIDAARVEEAELTATSHSGAVIADMSVDGSRESGESPGIGQGAEWSTIPVPLLCLSFAVVLVIAFWMQRRRSGVRGASANRRGNAYTKVDSREE
ncbi:hypothetical protein BC830DRAFT_1117056 [Chytriomyces sp. MP71]|nr:hypothetical protein BC830DRAFT_1117056 [Chytriomyces sp. MP71]